MGWKSTGDDYNEKTRACSCANTTLIMLYVYFGGRKNFEKKSIVPYVSESFTHYLKTT